MPVVEDTPEGTDLVVFAGVRIVAGLLLKPLLHGRGFHVDGLGSFQQSGGGVASFQAALQYARDMGAEFMVLVSLPSARLFWRNRGFKDIPAARSLRHHARHCKAALCNPSAHARQTMVRELGEESAARNINIDVLIGVLRDVSGCAVPPSILWL